MLSGGSLDVAADVGETVLTFLPGNVVGGAGGHLLRTAAEEHARDPRAWLAARRALAQGDSGVIDLAAFYRREPIELADGTTWAPLDDVARDEFTTWRDTLPTSGVRASGPEGAYQVRLYGATEHRASSSPPVWPDGATPDYGAIADAKYRTSAATSFYDPSTLGNEKIKEIATNDPDVAAFIEARLRALGINGYVRLEQ